MSFTIVLTPEAFYENKDRLYPGANFVLEYRRSDCCSSWVAFTLGFTIVSVSRTDRGFVLELEQQQKELLMIPKQFKGVLDRL